MVGFLSCSRGIETEFKMRLLRIRAVSTFFFLLQNSAETEPCLEIINQWRPSSSVLKFPWQRVTFATIAQTLVFQRLTPPAACFQEYLQQLCAARLVEPGLNQARQAPESFWWVSPGCGVEETERERRSGPWAGERGGSEAVSMVGNMLMWRAYLPPGSRWCLVLGYSQKPILFQGPEAAQGSLIWCPWLLSPLRAMQRPVVWATTWGFIGVWESCCHGGHADLRGLHCHLETWWHPGPGCCCRPSLGPWLFHSQDVCWCLVAHIATKACIDARGLGHNLGPCGCLRAVLLPGPIWAASTATQSHGIIWARATAQNHVCVCGSIMTRICVDVHSSWYCWKPCQCHGSGLTPWVRLVSEGHTDAQGLVCHLRPCLCPRAMLPLGPYWTALSVLPPGHGDAWDQAVAKVHPFLGLYCCCAWGRHWCHGPCCHGEEEVIGTTSVEVQGWSWAGPASHWPWDSWPFPLLITTGELASTIRKDDPRPPHGHAPYLDSTLELPLLLGWAGPEGHESNRNDSTPIVCHVVTRVKEKCPLLHPLLVGAGDRTCPRIMRAGWSTRGSESSQHLGRTLELTLLVVA